MTFEFYLHISLRGKRRRQQMCQNKGQVLLLRQSAGKITL